MDGLEAALERCATKREVAALIGHEATKINSTVQRRPDLLETWRAMPADGAFAGRCAGLPRAVGRQEEADMLVAEAATDLLEAGHPLDGRNPQRQDTVRLLFAIYAITGTMSLRRGWVRSVMLALRDAGHDMPSSKVVRWYRCALVSDAAAFIDMPGVDPELVTDLSGHR